LTHHSTRTSTNTIMHYTGSHPRRPAPAPHHPPHPHPHNPHAHARAAASQHSTSDDSRTLLASTLHFSTTQQTSPAPHRDTPTSPPNHRHRPDPTPPPTHPGTHPERTAPGTHPHHRANPHPGHPHPERTRPTARRPPDGVGDLRTQQRAATADGERSTPNIPPPRPGPPHTQGHDPDPAGAP
jgi:hypothetical protein